MDRRIEDDAQSFLIFAFFALTQRTAGALLSLGDIAFELKSRAA